MLEKIQGLFLGIIKILSLKKGGKIRWASHVYRLFTNTLVTSIGEKYYCCTGLSGVSLTRNSASQQINTIKK